MTPFEKWAKERGYSPRMATNSLTTIQEVWQACAAEAERLCREQVRRDTMIHGPVLCYAYCHQQDAEAIAQLREVDRGHLEALTGHTQGPWKVDENGPSVIGEGGAMPICDMRGWGRLTGQGIGGRALAPGVARGIQQSNAALCAAAPDLIAEVRALRAERDALSQEIDSEAAENNRLRCEADVLRNSNRSYELTVADCHDVLKSQKAELDALRARVAELSAELDALKGAGK